ncbi:MAG: hypothetical protein FWG70_00885 [Oscillospiraceae bacterium]|nr:hypothetical protein [Oscillospiraceae bacterium]
MSRETDAILQSILYHHRKAKINSGTIDDCIRAVEAMCTKENLDAIEALLAKEREELEKK